MLSPQLQHPNWDTPLVCLVINCPQKPFRRVIQQRQNFFKKPKTKQKNNYNLHRHFQYRLGSRGGCLPCSSPPTPPVLGFAAFWHLQGRSLTSAKDSGQSHRPGQVSDNRAIYRGPRQMQPLYCYTLPFSNALTAFPFSGESRKNILLSPTPKAINFVHT